MDIAALIKANKGTLVDVRTYGEFIGGHAPGSKNIPLDEVPNRLVEFEEMEKPILLCCASGNRSGQAVYFLSRNGIECANAGSWLEVNYYKAEMEEEELY
jgi:rhodanese-related sulfurtransferase